MRRDDANGAGRDLRRENATLTDARGNGLRVRIDRRSETDIPSPDVLDGGTYRGDHRTDAPGYR